MVWTPYGPNATDPRKNDVDGPDWDPSKKDPVKPSPAYGPRGYPIGPGAPPPGTVPGVSDPFTPTRPFDSPDRRPGTPSTQNPYGR